MSNTSPLAEAIELLLGAARGIVDGPGGALRDAAVSIGEDDHSADDCAASGARIGLTGAQAAWGWVFAVGDALSILANPPHYDATFVLDLPPDEVASNEDLRVRVVPASLVWDWQLGARPSPMPVVIPFTADHPAGTTTVEMRLKPAPLVAACTIDLEITRLTSGHVSVTTYPLDVTTQRFTSVDEH